MKLKPKLVVLILAACVPLMACDESPSKRARPPRCDESAYSWCAGAGMCGECFAAFLAGIIEATKNTITEAFDFLDKAPRQNFADAEAEDRLAKSKQMNPPL
jgi:hypothetical protein